MQHKYYQPAPRRDSKIKVCGIPCHEGGPEEIHSFMEDTIRKGQKALILNLNIHAFVLALKNAWYKELLNVAQFVLCDGDGVRWGIKIMGFKAPPKIPVTRWMWDLGEFCSKRDFSVYLLGGEPGIAEEAGKRLAAKYPGLKIAGTRNGFFRKEGEETDQVIDEINKTSPDFLWVCFGMPYQEKWIYQNWHRIKTHFLLDGGAVLDYVAGKLGKAPEWTVRFHLE